MSNPDLSDAEIRLIDILPDRLALLQEWLTFAQRAKGWKHRISVHTDLRDGLRGVTLCTTAISVGGDRLWRYDATHPQLDGIFQSVGDTVGPGGAVRALRHAPALRKIAQTLAEVGAPDAVLIQLTNPLNALTAFLDKTPGIRVFGFCHGYYDTECILAHTLGLSPIDGEKLIAIGNPTPCKVEVAGNNHFMFVNKLSIGDKTWDQSTLGELTPRIFDNPFREAIWSRYGVLVGNGARHPIEFLPDFLTRKWRFGLDWGVQPVAGEIDPLNGSRQDNRQERLEADLKAARGDVSIVNEWEIRHSREPIAEIMAAFHTGKRMDVHLNLRNQGALAGIADDAHVELYCRIEAGQVHRPSVKFPDRITGEIARIAKSQLMLSQCCEQFDEDLLVEALYLDALMPKDKTYICKLMREMIDFQRALIFPA